MSPTKAPLVPVPTDDDLSRTLQPQGWPRPLGYANGMTAKGRVVVTGGVVGWDVMQNFPDTFAAQARQTFSNILRILAEGGAGPEHVVRLTWYVVDKREYLASLSALAAPYRAVMGRHYPAMTAVEVRALIEDRARVEIEATAVVPDPAAG